MAKKASIQNSTVHELKITLRRTKPPIWRRIAVPSDVTLAELHEIIQIVMGWLDTHLHQFRVKTKSRKTSKGVIEELTDAGGFDESSAQTRGERLFSDKRVPDTPGEDERGVVLGKLCPQSKDMLSYEYDFGDGWEHAIEVVKVYSPDQQTRYPKCLAGKCACPPEDCGGVWGYYHMLHAIRDPQHAEHDDLKEWLGDEFDENAFSVDAVNEKLAEWSIRPNTA